MVIIPTVFPSLTTSDIEFTSPLRLPSLVLVDTSSLQDHDMHPYTSPSDTQTPTLNNKRPFSDHLLPLGREDEGAISGTDPSSIK